jgi:L-alanine-DL-glutamate epimerase-like enolase superfamily enzyme
VLVVKPARVGGPVAVAEIAKAAAAHEVPVVISTLFETGIGIAAALIAAAQLRHAPGARFPAPLAHGLATAGLLEHDLLEEPLVVEAGRMHAPGGAGTGRLGIRVSRRAVARFAAEFVEETP